MVHEWANDTRRTQSSSDRGVGCIEPEEDCSLAERPTAARIGCRTTTQRHDAADAELRAN